MHESEDHEPKLEFGGPFGPGPRETVADLLRRAREETGQNLSAVAQVLRIRLPYLEAIECGDFDRLPGATYAVGFLRTYADYLGLDGEDMVERFKAETQAAERRSELIFPEPVAEGRIPGGAIIFVSVILLAAVYGGWFYLSQQGRTVADLIPAWPAPTQTETQTAATTDSNQAPAAAAPTESESAAAEPATPTEAAIVTTTSAQASTAPATESAVAPSLAESPAAPDVSVAPPAPSLSAPGATAAEPLPASTPLTLATVATSATAPTPSASTKPAVPTAAKPPPASESMDVAALVDQTVVIPTPPTSPETVIIPDDRSPQVYGGSNDESRIVIRALQDSWVQVRDAQDAILLTRVLRAGDSYRVPNVSGLTLLTGNAGGIELEVDGVRLPPVGQPGSVRRSIVLDPAQLVSGSTATR